MILFIVSADLRTFLTDFEHNLPFIQLTVFTAVCLNHRWNHNVRTIQHQQDVLIVLQHKLSIFHRGLTRFEPRAIIYFSSSFLSFLRSDVEHLISAHILQYGLLSCKWSKP